jgi:subtilisin family serine protease
LITLFILISFTPSRSSGQQPAYSPGQILVKFHAAALKSTDSTLDELGRRFRVESSEILLTSRGVLAKPVAALGHVRRLRVPSDIDIVEAARAYSRHPLVEYAQPNHLFIPHQAPDDTRYKDQDNLSSISWQNLLDGIGPRREEIIIGIIDSGVDYTHQDLSENIWINQKEASGLTGIDDDRNGYIDDIRGWDFGDAPDLPGKGDYLTPDNDPMDESGHGTRVAGIAGAVVNNAFGIAGAAIDAKIMPLRAGVTLQSNQTFLEEDDLAAAIIYAVENGARVINMSWGARENAKLIRDAIRFAASRDVILVSSAGNSGEAGLSYPAALDETIAVGATDQQDRLSGFSSTGVPLDLVAPGTNILSTFPGNLYLRGSGTSFSSPLVAGLSALLISRRPEWTSEQVRTTLIRATVDRGESGWDPSFGAGRIDARLLLQSLQNPKAPPSFSILGPSSDSGTDSIFQVTTQLVGSISGYRVSWALGRDPQSWTILQSGGTTDATDFVWNLSALPDTMAILRLEAEFDGERTQEDRIQVYHRSRPTPIFDPSFDIVLVGGSQTYQARWSTNEPTEGFLLLHSTVTAISDTFSSDLRDITQRITLPSTLPVGHYQYQLGTRGPGGLEFLTEKQPFTYTPFQISDEGLTETGRLPEAYFADLTVDLDQDGQVEIAAMPRIENQSYSPVEIFELQDDLLNRVFQTTNSFLPWTFGDADNDGDPDLLGVNVVGGTAHLRVYTNTSSNPFPAQEILDQRGTGGGEIADTDGDGQNEIVTSPVGRNAVQILRGGPTGFSEVALLDNPSSGSNIPGSRFLVADVDDDGLTEILAGDNDGDIWNFESDANQGYSLSWIKEGSDDTDASWVGGGMDLDEDGVTEFIVARTIVDNNAALNGHWSVEVYNAPTEGDIVLEWSIQVTGVITSGNGISVGDLDADGRPEIVVCLRPDIYIFRSDAPDSYRPIWHGITGLTDRPLIADLDLDGQSELLFNREGKLRIMKSDLPGYTRARPQLLEAQALSSDRVSLKWSETPGAVSYEIWRTDGESSREFQADTITGTTYLDTTVQANRIYDYLVIAVTEDSSRFESSSVRIRPNAAPELLSLTHPGPGQLALAFNEPMGISAGKADAYSVNFAIGKATSAILDRHGHRVVLSFASVFPAGNALTLTISSVTDSSGVPLTDRFHRVPFTSNSPTYPSSGIADFNGDGSVTFSDFILFVQAYGSTETRFDLNTNGRVDFSDFIIFANLFGK